MNYRFDDLWASAADDGASSPVGVYTTQRGDVPEVDLLLDAWLRERTDRIECALALDQARRVIAGLLADGEVTPRRRRQANLVIRAIRGLQNDDPDTLRH